MLCMQACPAYLFLQQRQIASLREGTSAVNKAELIEAITEKVGDRRTAGTAVEAVLETIQRAVFKGEKVALTGFGVFEKVDRAARTARNPATGATVKLKKTSVPKFRPGQGFKEVVSGARKLPAVPKAAARPNGAAAAPAKAGPAKAGPAKAAGVPAVAKAAPTPAPTSARAPAKAVAAKAADAPPSTGRAKAAGVSAGRNAGTATAPAKSRATAAGAGKAVAKAPTKDAATAKAPAKTPAKAPAAKAPAAKAPAVKAPAVRAPRS